CFSVPGWSGTSNSRRLPHHDDHPADLQHRQRLGFRLHGVQPAEDSARQVPPGELVCLPADRTLHPALPLRGPRVAAKVGETAGSEEGTRLHSAEFSLLGTWWLWFFPFCFGSVRIHLGCFASGKLPRRFAGLDECDADCTHRTAAEERSRPRVAIQRDPDPAPERGDGDEECEDLPPGLHGLFLLVQRELHFLLLSEQNRSGFSVRGKIS